MCAGCVLDYNFNLINARVPSEPLRAKDGLGAVGVAETFWTLSGGLKNRLGEGRKRVGAGWVLVKHWLSPKVCKTGSSGTQL
jgi:hypothetical protein